MRMLTQEAELVSNLQVNKPVVDKPKNVNNEYRRTTYKNNLNQQAAGRRVINVERLFPPSSPHRLFTTSSTITSASNATAISISDLDTAEESRKFDVHNKTPIDHMPFYKVSLNKSHGSWEKNLNNVIYSICTWNKNVMYRQDQQEGRNEHPCPINLYRQKSRRAGSIATARHWKGEAWPL